MDILFINSKLFFCILSIETSFMSKLFFLLLFRILIAIDQCLIIKKLNIRIYETMELFGLALANLSNIMRNLNSYTTLLDNWLPQTCTILQIEKMYQGWAL